MGCSAELRAERDDALPGSLDIICGVREIARQISCDPGTISRELKL